MGCATNATGIVSRSSIEICYAGNSIPNNASTPTGDVLLSTRDFVMR